MNPRKIPPVAKKVDFLHKYFKEIPDKYHWLKDQNPLEKRPEIIEYLKAENDYSASIMVPYKDLSSKIYDEILSRINEDDQEAPVYHDPYFYYSRTEKGLSYPIKCRKLGMDGEEQVILNLNELKHEYMSLGSVRVSPNHKLLAYTIDLDGGEKYSVYIKNLDTGEFIPEEFPKTAGELEWANDNNTLFYLTLDHTQRPYKVFSHTIGEKDAKLIYQEDDEKFWVSIEKSTSQQYIFISSGSSLTTEYHYINAFEPNRCLKMFLKRNFAHKYYLYHQGDRFLILTNGSKKYLNFRLCSCPIESVDESGWEEVVNYDPFINIIDVVPFKDYVVCINNLI